MKKYLFLLLLLFAIPAWGQAGQATEIKAGPTNPATCTPTRGWWFWNTSTSQMYTCSATNTWTTTGGAGPIGSIFYASTQACNGATNCVQWVDDDSTDNCGAATTAWLAAINAYGGPGNPIISIMDSAGTGKAFKFATASCHLEFDIPATVHLWANIDCGQPSGNNCIQVGPTGLGSLTNAQSPKYQIDGGGVLVGGVNLTNAGIELEPHISNAVVTGLQFTNFGAGNATLGSCTNYAILIDSGVAEATISYNEWLITDSTAGRCAFANPAGLGTNTIGYIGNVFGGQNLLATTCSSTGILDGGSYGISEENNIYGFGIPIRVQGIGHRITDNQIDSAGCQASSVSAAIQYGATSSSATVGQYTINNNTVQYDNGSAHTHYLFARAGDSTAVLQDVLLTNNISSLGASTLNGTTMPTTVTCGIQSTSGGSICKQSNNVSVVGVVQCGNTNAGWQLENIIAACSSSAQTANLGATALYTPLITVGTSFTCSIVLTTAGSSSSTLPQCVVSYTDAFTSQSQTVTITPVWASGTVGCAGSTTNTIGNSCQGSSGVVAPKAGSAVTYSTINYAANSAASMQFNVLVRANQQ